VHSLDVTKALEPLGFEMHTALTGEEGYAAELTGVRMLIVDAGDPTMAPATTDSSVFLVVGGAAEHAPAIALYFPSVLDLVASLMRGHHVIDPDAIV
jgi:hypothetical protein